MGYCNNQKPTSCKLISSQSGDPINTTHVFEKLGHSVLFATQNVSVYMGQTAVFALQIERPEKESSVTVVAYVNNSKEDTACELVENGTIISRVCSFPEVQKSDDASRYNFIFGIRSLELSYAMNSHPTFMF